VTPILPYSAWTHYKYGIIVVMCSEAIDKKWFVTFIRKDNKELCNIETDQDEWLHSASFICELHDQI
jgi:hypothetical protein